MITNMNGDDRLIVRKKRGRKPTYPDRKGRLIGYCVECGVETKTYRCKSCTERHRVQMEINRNNKFYDLPCDEYDVWWSNGRRLLRYYE